MPIAADPPMHKLVTTRKMPLRTSAHGPNCNQGADVRGLISGHAARRHREARRPVLANSLILFLHSVLLPVSRRPACAAIQLYSRRPAPLKNSIKPYIQCAVAATGGRGRGAWRTGGKSCCKLISASPALYIMTTDYSRAGLAPSL